MSYIWKAKYEGRLDLSPVGHMKAAYIYSLDVAISRFQTLYVSYLTLEFYIYVYV